MAAFTIASSIEAISSAHGASEIPLFFSAGRAADDQGWQTIVDERLSKWAKQPAACCDQEIEPPTAESIRAATQLTNGLRRANVPPIFSVAPIGDGGIVFAGGKGPIYFAIEISDSGDAEVKIFENSVLVRRGPLALNAE